MVTLLGDSRHSCHQPGRGNAGLDAPTALLANRPQARSAIHFMTCAADGMFEPFIARSFFCRTDLIHHSALCTFMNSMLAKTFVMRESVSVTSLAEHSAQTLLRRSVWGLWADSGNYVLRPCGA